MPERPAGVEPAHPPWQGDRLPLHHGRLVGSRIVKDREHREGLEPSSPHYGCGVLAARSPVLVVVSGTGGYRTHIIRFKRPVHYPVCHSPESVGAVGVEPRAPTRSVGRCVLKGRRSHRLSYAPVRVGPEGLEPTPAGLKVRCAANYTTTPYTVGRMRL